MSSWVGLALSFTIGLAVGGALAFAQCKSRLDLYRYFIETRLGATFLGHPSRFSPGKSYESLPGTAASDAQSESSEEADCTQNG
ncbi:MAG: hypothetical protein P8Z30_17720 [Acidobacteriota bacterium]